MGSNTNANIGGNAIKKILSILKLENKEITILYFYATLNGIIQLSLPLGIQSIISFVMASSISTSLILLIVFVIVGVFITGLIAVKQLQLIEKIQQKIFVKYAIQYAQKITVTLVTATAGRRSETLPVDQGAGLVTVTGQL
jgi:ABC-type bacteriocin/lantibiotic exporter with double-glycine peptidase domain